MGVKYILNQAGNKMGLNPSTANERSVLLRFLNEAAREVYVQSDMVGSLMEQLFKINGDQTVSFPAYVGEIRAVRSADTHVPFHINRMRPRYNVTNWPDMWRQYRIKNQQTLHTSVTNQAAIVLTVHAVENPPVQITVCGPTDYSSRIGETVVMDAVSKTTNNVFNDVVSLAKDRYNDYDVIVSDVDDNELATLPNDQLESSYLIIDISEYPYSNNDGGSLQAHYVEVLYKKRLPVLSLDSDEYPCKNCDDILVNKMLQLWMEEQEKVDLALVYDGKATRSMARIQENENRATEDVVGIVPNTHDELLVKIRANRPKWFPAVRST